MLSAKGFPLLFLCACFFYLSNKAYHTITLSFYVLGKGRENVTLVTKKETTKPPGNNSDVFWRGVCSCVGVKKEVYLSAEKGKVGSVLLGVERSVKRG